MSCSNPTTVNRNTCNSNLSISYYIYNGTKKCFSVFVIENQKSFVFGVFQPYFLNFSTEAVLSASSRTTVSGQYWEVLWQ